MSSIDPRRPKWIPKEPRRPMDASDTSEESEDEHLRKAAKYEVRLELGNIEYGQDVAYYDDNQTGVLDITYLQKNQAFTDRSLFIKDKKGRVIRKIDDEKIKKRKENKKKRFERKKMEKVEHKIRRGKEMEEIVKKQKVDDQEIEEFGLPTSFGKPVKEKVREQIDFDDNSDGTHSSDYEDICDYPVTHMIEMKPHFRAVTDFDINSKHSQLATCSSDYTVKHFDFLKMDSTLQPFRSYDPMDGHPVRSVQYSLDDKHVLTCTGGIQLRVFSTEGRLHYESVRGDMYMADMNNTHGHTNIITQTYWHPSKPTYLASSSLDSTVRVWDLHGRLVGVDKQLGHKTLHKARSQTYTRLAVDTFAWAPNGNFIVGGCAGGSLHLWETEKGNSVQAKLVNYAAHKAEITNLKFFSDNSKFVSRSMDGTLKLWDIRNLKEEAKSLSLSCENYRVQVDLSPDEKFLVTGTSPKDKDEKSYFKIIDAQSFDEVESMEFDSPVVAVKWHKYFNQIFLGMGDGRVNVLFTPHVSSGGIVECVKRVHVEDKASEIEIQKPVITPYSLSQFKVSYATKDKVHQRLRDDPNISQKPRGPLFDPSADGRMSGINTVTQYILSSIHAKPRPEDDPREALLSYQPESQNPEWVDNAYTKTQPNKKFDYRNDIFPEKAFLQSNQNQKCKSCGLKFCLCPKRRTKDEPLSGIEKRPT